MRQFWIALVCLSTFAMTLNIVSAVAVGASVEGMSHPPSEVAANAFSPSVARAGGEVPTPATVMLLVAGLSGLTVVGGRNRDQEKPSSVWTDA